VREKNKLLFLCLCFVITSGIRKPVGQNKAFCCIIVRNTTHDGEGVRIYFCTFSLVFKLVDK
jgi:hypothetical protein